MVLTQERAETLVEFLNSDDERATKLLVLDAEVALEQINASGNDFTLEELQEFDQALETAVTQGGELDAEALDDVSGGVLWVALRQQLNVAKWTQKRLEIQRRSGWR